ncbi:MAG: hypothetical protein SF029_08685 [bacterium]|nr:hypothetical protein [bacterium]
MSALDLVSVRPAAVPPAASLKPTPTIAVNSQPAPERTPGLQRNRYALPVLLLVTLLTLIAFDRPLVRGDGLAYLIWIDTLVLDGDVNFNNQHDRFREINTYQIAWNDTTQRWVNIFPFGVAFVQAPFYVVGHVLAQADIGNANPDYFRAMQGVTLPYSLLLMIGANVMALATVALSWGVGRRFCDDVTAALVVYALLIGTPLLYYSSVSPVNSHNPGAFGIAGLAYLFVRTLPSSQDTAENERPKSPLFWLLLGLFAALSILSRWQLALVVVPLWTALTGAALRGEVHWRGLLLATITAGVALLPLPLIWNTLFGSPFLVPFDAVSDQAFIRDHNNSVDVLRVLVVHSPLVLLSFAGVIALITQQRGRLGLLLAAIIGLQLFINGAALDWDAGDSYGMRRMSEIYAIYVLLGCAAVGAFAAWGRERRWRWLLPIMRGLLTAAVAYSLVYLMAHLVFTWTNTQGVFSAAPGTMIAHWLRHPYRWQVAWEVYRAHVGPLAWAMPGP